MNYSPFGTITAKENGLTYESVSKIKKHFNHLEYHLALHERWANRKEIETLHQLRHDLITTQYESFHAQSTKKIRDADLKNALRPVTFDMFLMSKGYYVDLE